MSNGKPDGLAGEGIGEEASKRELGSLPALPIKLYPGPNKFVSRISLSRAVWDTDRGAARAYYG